MSELVLWLDKLGMNDLGQVGGKNASLGEMIGNLSELGVSVPGGFATTADAYKQHLHDTGLDRRIAARMKDLDVDDVDALAAAGKEIRGWIADEPLPKDLEDAIRKAYKKLCGDAGGIGNEEDGLAFAHAGPTLDERQV